MRVFLVRYGPIVLISVLGLASFAFAQQHGVGIKPMQNVAAHSGCATSRCAADLVGDGVVNVEDLLAVVNEWGPCPQPCSLPCLADVIPDCSVNVDDLLAIIHGWGQCPAPSNDSCVNYTITNVEDNVPFCTTFATTDGRAELGCSFCCEDPQLQRDVWFGFSTSAFAGNYAAQIDTCGADFDTKIAVYEFAGVNGCRCSLRDGQLIACNDDAQLSNCNLQSRVQFRLEASSCYRVRVGGYNGQTGSGTLHVHSFINGDECFNAIDLGVVTSEKSMSILGSNNAASNMKTGSQIPQAPCTSFSDGADVWYKFELACEGNVMGTISTCNQVTDFDTILTLYRGECDDLKVVSCNDDSDQGDNLIDGVPRKSMILLPTAISAGCYYIRISGYHGAAGNYRLNVQMQCGN